MQNYTTMKFHTTMNPKELPLAHVHTQAHWHDEAYIVANTEGVCALLNALTQALVSPTSQSVAELICADGEAYQLHIIRQEQQAEWEQARLPYTNESASDKRPDVIHPAKLISQGKSNEL